MKLSKLLLAVVGATVLLGTLVGSASARMFSVSSQSNRASFAGLAFRGSFGTIECEIVLEGSFHSRTSAKSVGTLLGYITAANIPACKRWGVTINRETLPWHRRYGGFAGALPNILEQNETVSGVSWRLRESFGITCTVTGATLTNAYTRNTATGAIASASVSGTAPCSGIPGTLSGSTTNVDNRAGARITVTLI